MRLSSKRTSLLGVLLVCSMCGVQKPPPHFPIPEPAGITAYRCHPPDVPAKPVIASPAPFDATLHAWTRTGAFAQNQPIDAPNVRAQDVTLAPSDAQRKLMSANASARATSVVPIGGDYWRDTPYPIGPVASGPWVSSAFKAGAPHTLPSRGGEDLTGTMTSGPFALASTYLRVYVGGTGKSGVGVQLLVRSLPKTMKCREAALTPEEAGPAAPAGFTILRTVRGSGAPAPESERLDAVEIALDASDCDVRKLQGVVRIYDESATGHVNVGAIGLTDAKLTDAERDATPLWGLADYHTHPTNYLGLGGLQGVHAVWGVPGGSMSEYTGTPDAANKAFTRDIPECDEPTLKFNGHHGGLAAPIMINAAEGRIAPSVADLDLSAIAFTHGPSGGPTFANTPDFRAGAHEQYHISAIHRAYLGGLRLMSAMAIHNRGLEYGVGWVRCGENGNPTVDTTPDWTVIRAHVQAMRQLAELNSDWMQIAYTPNEARRIIQKNKLAVVLGVEVPELGLDDDGSPAEQVGNLEALGVRQVIVVHGMDNLLGGTAVFEDLYNTVNDWMYRPKEYRDKVETLSGITIWKQYPASFYDVTTRPSPPVTTLPVNEPIEATEPIQFRLANPERVVLSDIYPRPPSSGFIIGTFGRMHPLVSTTPLGKTQKDQYFKEKGPHRNVRGLTGRGAEFVQRLMARGMLIDLAHMSDATLASTYDVAGDSCGAYPLMVSHAHFRALQEKVDYSDMVSDFDDKTSDAMKKDLLAGTHPMNACIRDNTQCNPAILAQAKLFAQRATKPGTTIRENLAREYDIASSEIQQVRVRNGVMGVFIGQGTLDPASMASQLPDGMAQLPIALDCAGSSQGLGAAMLFANKHMHGMGGLGLASDFAFTGSAAPRFGPNACAGYLAAGTSLGTGAQLLETLLDPQHYAFAAQKDAVNYSSESCHSCANGKASPGATCGTNVPLDPYVIGERTYDVNVDGFAHYGLAPDMLQDVSNQLHDARHAALDTLFDSAEAYIDMWREARRLSRCEETGLCPVPHFGRDPMCEGNPPAARPACGASCPCGWNHGAPLHQVDEITHACDPGKLITFPSTVVKWQQHRTNVLEAGDLSKQGDWAIVRLQKDQKWKCGDSGARDIGCKAPANYVKVRRILDTTVSRYTDRCDEQPMPPEDGNRSVLFQCLVGPDDGASK
jgi:microsomal dipeptidase-like Zn-dependent dipeptidase